MAICLNAWCFESDFSFNRHKAKNMTLAYNNRRPLTPSELSALPMLARGAALRFLTTRLFDWLNVVEGALVKPKDPMEYVHKLRFHQSIKNASIYGI